MRVIDTLEDCITYAPPDCSYLVLSYVWGSTNFLRLVKENAEALMIRSALQHIKIPKTITDAMHVTKILGKRYLWVDSLCICQDDEKEKMTQIQKMDKIYSQAALTIIALDQNHADGGLWRKDLENRASQQIVEEVCGLRFVSTGPILDGPLENSPWITRAWTYQEFVLSKRLLFFTEQMVYFSCEMAASAEDNINCVHSDGCQQMERSTDDEFSTRVSSAVNYPIFWPVFVREYTKRALSFESDGLNAAAGVLENYGRGLQDGFICGLPVSTLFEGGLLWYAAEPLRRRGPSASGKLFPSWSWVGWVGDVDYDQFEDSNAVADARIISEWSLEHEEGVLRSTDLHFPAAPGKLVSTSSAEAVKRATASLPLIQTGILRFRTRSAFFAIEDGAWNQFLGAFKDYEGKYTGLYKILKHEVWIGSVHMEHTAAEELGVGSEELYEFLVLSKSTDDIWPISVGVRPRDDDADNIPLYAEHLMDEDGWDVYNVMLVKWDGGVAYRRGIGQIHKASFDKADHMMKEVRLG